MERAEFKIVDELGGLELLSADYEKQNFSRHSHEGYTIGVIDEGAQRFYRTGENHVAPQNTIILVNADEVHTGHSAEQESGWSYQAMYPLTGQFQQITDEVFSSGYGAPYFPEAVVNDPEMAIQLRQLFAVLANSDNRLFKETLTYNTFVKLISRHGKSRKSIRSQAECRSHLQLVRSFLDDRPQADVSLEELARLSGLSPFHLNRLFQKEYGLPPHAYQIQSRLRMARSLMKQGYSISDAAQESGFHDQSHFHRHFKKANGYTPGQFLKSL